MLTMIGLFCLGVVPRAVGSAEPSKAAALPRWSAIENAVLLHFHAQKNRHPLDILSRDETRAVLRKLEQIGWKPADGDGLMNRTLAEDHFLVRALRAKGGIPFMRAVGGMSQGYDRLDQLSQLSDGRSIVQRLIDGPDGHKLLEYMTQASGGMELGAMLSATPGARDFNKPTGRIYTVDALLAALDQSYRGELNPKRKARPTR